MIFRIEMERLTTSSFFCLRVSCSTKQFLEKGENEKRDRQTDRAKERVKEEKEKVMKR